MSIDLPQYPLAEEEPDAAGPVLALEEAGLRLDDVEMPDTLEHALQQVECAGDAGERTAILLQTMYQLAHAAGGRMPGEAEHIAALLEQCADRLPGLIRDLDGEPRHEPVALASALREVADRIRNHGDFGVEAEGSGMDSPDDLRERFLAVARRCEGLVPGSSRHVAAAVSGVMAVFGVLLAGLMVTGKGDGEMPPKPERPQRVRPLRDGKKDGQPEPKPDLGP